MADEYIRREDAKDALQEKVFHNLTDEFYGAMQAIDELPSADVVPVVHARWKFGKCTKCGGDAPFWCMASTYRASSYCPDCGAKMDEEVDDE